MFVFINFVRAIATCLITNSHFEPIYTYDFIATGGALGNSLFFLATGFCLYNCTDSFPNWYTKRLLRIYIPLIPISFFCLYHGKSLPETIFFSFVFPQNYWFICSLIILYPLYYLVVKYPFKHRKYICTTIITVLYIGIYLFLDKSSYLIETVAFYGIRFSYIFSFFLMLTGAYFRKHFNEFQNKLFPKRKFVLISFFFSLFAYYFFLLMMNIYNCLYKIQFLETVFCILSSTLLFLFLLCTEEFLLSVNENRFTKYFSLLGNYTLEIYLVQFPIINIVGNLRIPSLAKFVIAITTILLSSYIVKSFTNYILKMKEKIIKSD